MHSVKKKIVFTFLLFCCSIALFAKDDYHAEVGFNFGAAYYLGDLNSLPFRNALPDYGILLRYKHNKRLALRAELSHASIKEEKKEIIFQNKVNRLDFCGEFNFFDLEKNEFARNSKIFSPYIFTGIGVANHSFENNGTLHLSIPFGLGVKVRINKRFNFNVQFANNFLLSDKLEGKREFNNPNGLNGSNFMNNDLISSLTVGLTINFWKKECRCVMRND